MRAVMPFGARKHRHFLFAVGALMVASVMLIISRFHDGRVLAPVAAQAPLQTQFPIAARSIAAGSTITSADVRIKAVNGAPPPGAMLSGESALGRVAGKSFAAGDAMTGADLRDAASVGIAARVAAGQRAFSIRIAPDEIVGGFLQSADHVDVIATIPGSVFPAKNAQDQSDRSQSVLLLQDIFVLAVGENLSTRGAVQSTAQTVSLSLTPDQLARLTLALRFGKISLAIRNPGDTSLSNGDPVTLGDLIPGRIMPLNPVRSAGKRDTGIPFYAGPHKSMVHGSSAP